MSQVPDRKKRRQYLGRKAEAYTSGILCGLFLLAMCSIALLCLCVAAYTLLPFLQGKPEGAAFIGSLVSGAAAGFSAWQLWKGIKGAKERANTAYVSPVTADTLPADEILVRGSETPPVVQSRELLRSANEQPTPTEEL